MIDCMILRRFEVQQLNCSCYFAIFLDNFDTLMQIQGLTDLQMFYYVMYCISQQASYIETMFYFI